MLDFSTNIQKYSMDLLDEIKLFFMPEEACCLISHKLTDSENIITIDGQSYVYPLMSNEDKYIKRETKHALYLALKAHTEKHPPWGSLTGVRPTKLAYEYLAKGGSPDSLVHYLSCAFDIKENKAEIITHIIQNQSEYIKDLTDKVNLYIHIPFCPSKCNYCSFPSMVKSDNETLSKYTDLIVREIDLTLDLISKQNKKVLSVYIGGGTPSVLDNRDINRVLNTIRHLSVEKTFEAGRPDSINDEKLETIKRGGVTRICLNPQTLRNETLIRIGRNHTAEQFMSSYSKARQLGFNINVDIIAGLDGESLQDFEYTLDNILPLNAENITVHTLSRKRASDNAYKTLVNNYVENMMDYAVNNVLNFGYSPYYLYKQKYMIGNLENIGFCKPGCECINNITVMEELVPVYACGAGAISKRIDICGDINRHQNAKDIKLFTEEFDERTAKKIKFLSK